LFLSGLDALLYPISFHVESQVHQPVAASAAPLQKAKSWREVVANSRSICTFIDLAGHERYLKTTIAGLTGSFPDYAQIIVNSLAGVTKMTLEHLVVVLALRIPLFCVVTKIDMCPPNVLKRTKKQLFRVLRTPGVSKKKVPMIVRSFEDIDTVLASKSNKIVPVFWVSCVSGQNLPLLVRYLSLLRPLNRQRELDPLPVEFSIDESFNVTGVGIVVSGTVGCGTLTPNTQLLMGPFTDGSFIPVLIRSIHCRRVPVDSCRSGDTCAVSLRSIKRKKALVRSEIRRGMVLVHPDAAPKPVRSFEAEVMVMHHPTTIKLQYQAVIHCGIVRQTAAITGISQDHLRTGDKARVRFRFMMRPEFIHERTRFVFREGTTKGIGWIRKLLPNEEDDTLPLLSLTQDEKELSQLGETFSESDDDTIHDTGSKTRARRAKTGKSRSGKTGKKRRVKSSKTSTVPSAAASEPAATTTT
jgi:GTPase